MKYFSLIDELMQYYTQGEFSAEAVVAKNEFYELAGIFDEQSAHFELKMAQFTDWYLFMRPLTKFRKAPIMHFVSLRPKRISEEDEIYYRNLSNNRYSLFEFIKLRGQDLHVRDLFSNYKLIIKDSPVTHGFDAQEYFQARLIPHEDSFLFSMAYCFHPSESSKFIQSEVKKIAKLPEADQQEARNNLLIRLFKMRNKFDQYKHVGIQNIYSNESRLRV